MNRAYIKPETKVYEIETQPMMAASDKMNVSNEVVTTQMGKENDFGFDLWADDED